MHPPQDQLNDYLDGLLDEADRMHVARHLEECADCALFVAQLQDVVIQAQSLPSIEPPPEAWLRIRKGVADTTTTPQRQGHRIRGWAPAWALATAAAIVMAFLAGRVIERRHQRAAVVQIATTAPRSVPTGASGDSPATVRERVLLVAVGDHLERSQMVLVELVNAHAHGELDISSERQWADELLASNRLYRQTAVQLGQTNVADVLDDLERVLVEVARGPSEISMAQLTEIQQRIEAQGILFKVKIIGSEARERGNLTPAAPKQPVS